MTYENETVLRAISACTTYSNNAETDQQPKVWHTVTDQFNQEHQVFSECPQSAIREFNELQQQKEVARLENGKRKPTI